jgi:cytochrome bd-type quinol oxidase subunit 1
VSPIGTGYVVASLVGFTAIYTILAVIDFGLMARYAKLDPDSVDEHGQEKSTGGDSSADDASADLGSDSEHHDDRTPALIY